MTWQTGSSQIDQLLVDNELERVSASRDHADFLIAQARRHLRSAKAIAEADPPGAYQLAWDAARKAMVAVLENEGLRPTRTGGHIAVVDALDAQIGDNAGNIFRTMRRMRRRRNESEYPSPDKPVIDVTEVFEVLPAVDDLLAKCERLLDVMGEF